MKTVIQGEKETIRTQLAVKTGDLVTPFDLTGNVEITVSLKHGGGVLTKLKTTAGVAVVGADTAGLIDTLLSVADTNGMAATPVVSQEITVDKGAGNVTRFQVRNAFTLALKIGA
jgi:hypothetical protein